MSPLAAPDELSEFLEHLAGAGSTDSRGHFTLDIEKAREKLRRFRLPTPHHYVLCLLSSACLAGARSLKLQTDGLDTIAQFDGTTFAFDDLKDLFGAFLTASSHDPFRGAVRELAMAVHGARALDPEFIVVESWGAKRGARLMIRGNSMTVEPLRESPFHDEGPRTLMHVHEKGGPLATLRLLVAQVRGVASPPERILTEAARYAETGVRVRAQQVNLSRLGVWPAWARLNPESSVRVPELLPRKSTFHRSLTCRVPFAGYLGFGDGPGGVLVVVAGVLFQPPLPLGYTTARAIIYAPYLAKDLSQTQLLQDEGFAEFTQGLMAAFDALVAEIVDAGMGLADWMEQPLREYMLRCRDLAQVPQTVREATLVPLANHELVSLNQILSSHKQHGKVAWANPPGLARGQNARTPEGALVLLRTPPWADALQRLLADQGPTSP